MKSSIRRRSSIAVSAVLLALLILSSLPMGSSVIVAQDPSGETETGPSESEEQPTEPPLPTETPTPLPTETPVPEPPPTETPAPEPTPTDPPNPEPTATTPPEATATPTPDNTPTPTPAVWTPFIDDFETGDLSRWTTERGLSVQSAEVASGTFAARGSSTGQETFASEVLSRPEPALHYRVKFKLIAQGDNRVTLLGFRTAEGNEILTVHASSDGHLGFHNGVDDSTVNSDLTIVPSIWHEIEVRVAHGAGAGQVEIWYDGNRLQDLSQPQTLGATDFGRVQLGDHVGGRAYDVAFDDVAVDTRFIQPQIVAPLPTVEVPIEPTSAPTSAPATPSPAPTEASPSAATPPAEETPPPTSTATATVESPTEPAAGEAAPAAISDGTGGPFFAAAAGETTLTFGADADARVESGSPDANFGTSTALGADASPAIESYLRFAINGVSGPVVNARLRLYVTNGTPNGPAIFAAGTTSWSETGVTWNNRPGRTGSAIANVGALTVNTWVEYDVTAHVTGNGTYSFAVIPEHGDRADFASREAATNRPELVVTYEGLAPPTVSASPPGGTYTQAQNVTLTASEPATIYYTTDGTDPTTSSPIYSTPIPIAVSTTLKFFAVTADSRSSSIVTEVYTINTQNAFGPTHDARVDSSNPATNYGSLDSLISDGSPIVESYLQFTVTGLTGPVTNAKLRLYAFNATSNGPAVYATSNSWAEGTITWNNRPARVGSPSDDLGAIPLNTWAEFNVTALVTGNGTVSFNLTSTSSDAVYFFSKESANVDLRPQLIVSSSAGTPPSVTATPPGGTYTSPQSVTLTASEPATIYYTTDGTDPTTASPVYSSPIQINATTTLKFFGVDQEGTPSPSITEVYTIIGDFVPPETTITSGPPNPSNQAIATFEFTSNEPGSTFECALDGGSFAVCISPKQYTSLTETSHTFLVRAIDTALNVDLSPASATWTVDLTPPTVSTVTPADAATNVDVATNVTAEFSEAINPATLTTTTFTLFPQGGSTAVPAAITYDPATRIGTLDPNANLAVGTSYTAKITGGSTGVKDPAGNPLAADKTWSLTTASAQQPVTLNFSADADARVQQAAPTTNFGLDPILSVDDNSAATDIESYLRFTVTGVTQPVTNAVLRLYVTNGTDDGPALFAAANSWTETGITWNNRPAPIGGVVSDLGILPVSAWVEYDVTSLVNGNGTFTFVLIPQSTNYAEFRSRESATNQPQLAVTYGGPPLPTVSATPPGGSYSSPQNVTLTASEPATIYYTTDGSEPTTSWSVYSSPIAVNASMVLKFFARTSDGRQSDVETETYTISATGYRDFAYGGATAPTAKESQSKLWYASGNWWGALYNPTATDFQIYRLDLATQTWSSTGTLVDGRPSAKIDALWDGSKLYTVSAVYLAGSANRVEVRRFSFGGGVYSLDAGFPVAINDTGTEVSTIAKDTTGTLWVSFTAGNQVYVSHSQGTNHASWVAPYVIPVAESTVTSDDISAIVAFGSSVGVMWSHYDTGNMSFAIHADGAPDNVWVREIAYGGPELADDHINLKTDSSGRVYAAAKTSLNGPSQPLINLLVRGVGGGWTSHVFGTVSNDHTRPIVQIDEAAGMVYMFATAPCCSGGVIYMKQSSLSTISFPPGLGTPIIASASDPAINNVTSTKQNVSAATGLVILASDDSTRRYVHNFLTLGSASLQTSTMATVGPSSHAAEHGLSIPGLVATAIIQEVDARNLVGWLAWPAAVAALLIGTRRVAPSRHRFHRSTVRAHPKAPPQLRHHGRRRLTIRSLVVRS